jgi:catechol 2,3-dioxygenase-like lactoylglutathione lyase family enzyme
VRRARPFAIQRLGHFGISVQDAPANLDFYRRQLGFRLSDQIDFGGRLPADADRAALGATVGSFLTHGSDHHSYVIFPKRAFDAVRAVDEPGMTVNQITWQVGSLEEVRRAVDWLADRGVRVMRAGRDMPGSNWHVYVFDPEGHVNELYYGIEQIGWDGRSKPTAMHARVFREPPDLPQPAEASEVRDALAKGIDLAAGHTSLEGDDATFDVQGILLPRPFKVVAIGPIALFVEDVAAAEAFYTEVLGLEVTARSALEGHPSVFLRAGTEHHSLSLHARPLRSVLGLSEHTTLGPIGLRVANYRQLRDALAFLEGGGATVSVLPPALRLGIEWAACVRDPDGHTVQLYFHMDQVAASPAPTSPVDHGPVASWPSTVAAPVGPSGEAFLGPWG